MCYSSFNLHVSFYFYETENLFFYNYFMRYLYFSFDVVIRNRTSARFCHSKSQNTRHNPSVHATYKKWEPTKKESFINNIDSKMVNDLNLLLDNSHNIPLNENQIDFFANYVKKYI